jgi:hypothetical protein
MSSTRRSGLLLASATLALSACGSAAASVDTTKLPLGDAKYKSSAQKGYVYSCQTRFTDRGGAGVDGPWIDNSSKTWNANAKISVQGRVTHNAVHSLKLASGREIVSGNGLPSLSGVFPIASDDPAYAYDRNPNSIKSYTLRVSLPANPRRASTATCVGGTIGVTTTGIPIFSAFDAGGRDASAHEVQDLCSGHPQMSGQYHYHALSKCYQDKGPKNGPSSLWGYALDGFGIYGSRDEHGRTLSTADLDACHGRTSRVKWHGRYRRIYHYVATADFPYLVGCYRGTPITSATGLGIGGGGGAPAGGPPPPPA